MRPRSRVITRNRYKRYLFIFIIVLFPSLAMVIACCPLASAEAYTEQDITIDAGDHQIPAPLL